MWAKPTKKQVDALAAMTQRVETLWDFATRRLAIADSQIRRDIDVWGHDSPPAASDRLVTREEIEESLADPDGAYRRLRLIMDAWCALWFWPLTEDDVKPPTLEQWYDALSMILGGDTMKASVAKRGDETLESAMTWDDLGEAEHNDRVYAGAARIGDVLSAHPWLGVCERIASTAGLLPLGAGLRPGVHRRVRLRSASRKPALGSPRLGCDGGPSRVRRAVCVGTSRCQSREHGISRQQCWRTRDRRAFVALAGDQLAFASQSRPSTVSGARGAPP